MRAASADVAQQVRGEGLSVAALMGEPLKPLPPPAARRTSPPASRAAHLLFQPQAEPITLQSDPSRDSSREPHLPVTHFVAPLKRASQPSNTLGGGLTGGRA